MNSYIGLDSLTAQLERKILSKPYEFNIMVVGETGMGKSTFINTLFSASLLDHSKKSNPLPHSEATSSPEVPLPILSTVEITPHHLQIDENGVSINLTIIDTPGFGDLVDNTDCWKPVLQYVQDQYANFHRLESDPKRPRKISDTRVHVVLYFINPTGHSLKPLDIHALQALGPICNVIPVIAKSDTLTPDEIAAFKDRIRRELKFHDIQLFPEALMKDPEWMGLGQVDLKFASYLPFSVVGSERNVLVDGKAVRGRRHHWGVVDGN